MKNPASVALKTVLKNAMLAECLDQLKTAAQIVQCGTRMMTVQQAQRTVMKFALMTVQQVVLMTAKMAAQYMATLTVLVSV